MISTIDIYTTLKIANLFFYLYININICTFLYNNACIFLYNLYTASTLYYVFMHSFIA